MADDHAVGPAERLHPLFMVTALGGSLRGMAGGYAFILYLIARGELDTALIVAGALFAFLFISLGIYWHRFSYRVGGNEIRIDSGILSRTHRSIPFDRIQDVEITQGPLARLLGLAHVKFETGGSAGGGEDEGVLQAISLARAEAIRDLVRSRRGARVDAAMETDTRAIFAMDWRRLLLAGTFNFSLAVFAALFGATQSFGDVLGFDPLSRKFWLQLLSAGDPIADFVLANRLASALAGAALLLLIGLATGVVRTVLRDYGFRLDRTQVGLRRRRGLLTRTDVTLPIRRAQAAILGTGPVRATFGWLELKLQTLAKDEGGSGDHMLAPLAREAEANAVLSELGWSPVDTAAHWQPVSHAYVTMLALGLAPLVVVGVVQALFVPGVGALFIVGLGGTLALRWLAWRRTGYRLETDRLLIRSGWWRRRTLVLPVGRIQSVDLAESFVGRWFGIARLQFGVAGGSGFSAHLIPALPRETARALREDLLASMS